MPRFSVPKFHCVTSTVVLLTLVLTGMFVDENRAYGAVVISDDFSTSTFSQNNRFRTNQADLGWFSTNGTTDWTFDTVGTNRALTNPGTTGGATSEGAIGQLVSTSSLPSTDNLVTLTFDYDVGSDATLFFHLTGWTSNVTTTTPTHNFLNNSGAQNGSIQNQGDTSNYADLNIVDGGDPNGGTGGAVALSGAGTFTATYDLSNYVWGEDEAPGLDGAPGLSGPLSGVGDFDFIQLNFASNVTNNAGDSAITLDNLLLTTSATVAAVPEPSSILFLALGVVCCRSRRR